MVVLIPHLFEDPKVLQAVRRCSKIQKLIYVSCSPNSVIKDFIAWVSRKLLQILYTFLLRAWITELDKFTRLYFPYFKTFRTLNFGILFNGA
jgi:hypothetical protein